MNEFHAAQQELSEAIAKQNDAFRRSEDDTIKGQWVLTRAVFEEGRDFMAACIQAVRVFDAFTEDMDPYGDHTLGAFNVEGKTVWFKIDLYDETYKYGAADPLDLNRTRRVLTILFPSDY